MSRVFYDHLIVIEDFDRTIGAHVDTHEQKQELWQLIDEILHHRIMGVILDKLPQEYHEEFLESFRIAPYNTGLLDYLREKIKDDIEESIKLEAQSVLREIVGDLRESSAKL